MDLLHSIPLTLTSLLLFSAVPFLYFAYHIKYWYRGDFLKRFDFGLTLVTSLLSILVLIKLATSPNLRDWTSVQVHLLHLAPLVLTLLITAHGRGTLRAGQPRAPRAEKTESSPTYNPQPLNREIERLSWSNLIIDPELQQELVSVIELLKDPKTAHRYGIEPPKGILLNGPPGTGKTTIAKVMANTAGLSFFVLRMDEVVSKWVGESEKNLTKLFQAAMKHAPAVIFIDEVDSIGKNRSGSGQQWAENLLNHLLQLVDGVIKTEGLYIIAATNRAELVDDALKRSGRLNRVIEVPLPGLEARQRLFDLYLSKLTLEPGLPLQQLAEFTQGCSPADIKDICNQAGLNAFKRESGGKRRDYVVSGQDIQAALNSVLRAPR